LMYAAADPEAAMTTNVGTISDCKGPLLLYDQTKAIVQQAVNITVTLNVTL